MKGDLRRCTLDNSRSFETIGLSVVDTR